MVSNFFFKKLLEKGTKCKSWTVPAAVSSLISFCNPLATVNFDGKAALRE